MEIDNYDSGNAFQKSQRKNPNANKKSFLNKKMTQNQKPFFDSMTNIYNTLNVIYIVKTENGVKMPNFIIRHKFKKLTASDDIIHLLLPGLSQTTIPAAEDMAVLVYRLILHKPLPLPVLLKPVQLCCE